MLLLLSRKKWNFSVRFYFIKLQWRFFLQKTVILPHFTSIYLILSQLTSVYLILPKSINLILFIPKNKLESKCIFSKKLKESLAEATTNHKILKRLN
jgi:hypothetical protein